MHTPRPLARGRAATQPPGVDPEALRAAVQRQAANPTPGIDDIDAYCAAQNLDETHREVTGPLLAGGGTSGMVVVDGWVLAEWGDPARPEMAFSVTKTVLSLVAGVAFDDGLLRLDEAVCETVDLAEFAGSAITWRHLLEQTSAWRGTLWGKPAEIDAQGGLWPGSAPDAVEPGTGWAYNDVRVNLLALALTALLGSPLPEVLADRIMRPIGASATWSWHGYRDSVLRQDGWELPVVSGGGHWGGGLWISAADLALLGQLTLSGGAWGWRHPLSGDWLAASWTPSALRADYGLLWWLNDTREVLPGAPASGRVARGNRRRHLLWVDPARSVVVAAHWCEDVGELVRTVSDLVDAAGQPPSVPG